MATQILTEAPIWFIIFCILAGFVYAFFLYRKDNKFEETSKIVKYAMFILRFLSVSIISFLLLSPFIKTLSKTIEQPVIVFAQDNSESILNTTDSTKYIGELSSFLSKLEGKYETAKYTFGEKLNENGKFNFSEKETDISQLIIEVQNKYFNRNIGALVIATDGIYNKGINPIYIAKESKFPIYTIALGDTSVKKDIAINDVKHNNIAFLNNTFPVQTLISAKKLKGKRTTLKIFDKKTLLHSEKIVINSNNFFKKVNFEIKAKNTGIRQLKLVLDSVSGEKNIKNNEKTIIVEVIDSKKKILILADAPHPDISAIRQAIKVNQNFETEFFTIRDFKKNINQYNLVILHNLPSGRNSATKVLADIMRLKIPTLYILGTKTDRRKFDRLQNVLTINHNANTFDDAQAKINNNFTLFELNASFGDFIETAPPLISPFGKYKNMANVEILLFRKIKNINTQQALMSFNSNSSMRNKSAVIAGEGLWRWRIHDYRKNKNHILFNEFINKTVQFLTLQVNKDRFKVNVEKIISENAEIIFNAEVYNKSYELVNKEEVTLQIKDEEDLVKDFVFSKTNKSYSLNIGTFKPGQYSWKAKTLIDGKEKTKSGIFTVSQINIESANTVADHNLLYKISELTSGKMLSNLQADSLINLLKKNENITAVSYSEKKVESIINLKFIFFLIIFLLSAEWFMRKFHGSY